MNLQNRYIFILGLAKFDAEIESTTFTLAKLLARDNQVFYIENPYTWKSFLLKKYGQGIAKRKPYFSFSSDSSISTGVPNLKVLITPPLISINWLPECLLYRMILKINEKIILHRIHQIIKKHKIDNYIFINSFNFYYPDLGKLLTPDLNVYHCVDPLVFSVERKHGLKSERKIVGDSNLIICTSRKLYDEKIKFNKNTFFIPNAADIQHSSKALLPELAIHDCLRNIKGPIVGYFGNIERRLDYDLLDSITEMNKDLSFIFAGPVAKESVPSWFFERPNIHLTGPVPYDQMPQVLKGFDVAIIPFKKDEFSATIFPLKLFEYLGSGKPVIATDFNPDLRDFTYSAVAYCNDADSFSESLRNAIYRDSEKLKLKRLAIARQNTWEKRADQFSELINNYVSKQDKESLVESAAA